MSLGWPPDTCICGFLDWHTTLHKEPSYVGLLEFHDLLTRMAYDELYQQGLRHDDLIRPPKGSFWAIGQRCHLHGAITLGALLIPVELSENWIGDLPAVPLLNPHGDGRGTGGDWTSPL